MEDGVFKFMDVNSNDKLLSFNEKDLNELWRLLDLYYISMRNSLGFNSNITFGAELEFEHAGRREIANNLSISNLDKTWSLVNDDTLDRVNGAEVVSPVLTDNVQTWQDLDKVCSIIRPNATIGNCAGGHIHIGAHILGCKLQSWLNFIKIWAVYERVIFRFSYGEFLTPRHAILKNAEPMAMEFWNLYLKSKKNNFNVYDIIHKKGFVKEQAVSFAKVCNSDIFNNNNTIEFRCPNATLDPIIWQNNINFFVKLLEYCNSDKFDNETIMKRHKVRCSQYCELKYYNDIYIEDAIELSDMIFDNNLDKINFLKQYVKSFEVGKSELEKAKPFTRTKVM